MGFGIAGDLRLSPSRWVWRPNCFLVAFSNAVVLTVGISSMKVQPTSALTHPEKGLNDTPDG
jgi:hypothetical protein